MRELGLNSGQVAQTLRAYVNGEVATTWLAGDGEQVQVLLRLPEIDRQHLVQMNKLPVAYTKDGQAIELARVAKIEPTQNPEVIRRQNLMRREAIFASVQGRPAGDVGADVQAMMKNTSPPEGIYFDLQGSTKDQQDASPSGIQTPSVSSGQRSAQCCPEQDTNTERLMRSKISTVLPRPGYIHATVAEYYTCAGRPVQSADNLALCCNTDTDVCICHKMSALGLRENELQTTQANIPQDADRTVISRHLISRAR
jgi:hypothetical protein